MSTMTKLLGFSVVTILFILPSTSDCRDDDTTLLSTRHAKFMQEHPGGIKNLSDEKRQLHIAIAQQLAVTGNLYLELGKANMAVAKFKEAIAHHATGELYYGLGNGLFKLGRFDSSIQAYRIAGALGYVFDESLYHRIACAYSRMGNKTLAFEYLEISIMNGYSNAEKIKRDSDLSYLRSQPEWERWLSDKLVFLEAEPVRGKGLIAELLFEGNASDNSGNGNHGTIFGATLTSDRFGKPDGAYYFDGFDDYIKIGNLKTISNTNEITISYWFYLKGHCDHDICGYLFDQNDALRLGLDPDRHIFIEPGTHADVHYNEITFDLNEWYHYAMSVGGGKSAKVYVNGKLVFETSEGVPNGLSDPPGFCIGASDETYRVHRGVTHHMNGIIDDVRIYNRALSGNTIKRVYALGQSE